MSILAVTGVQVNDRDCTGELLFVASPQVEFSWRIETDSPGSRQCGYQIVATDADGRLLCHLGWCRAKRSTPVTSLCQTL